jgi:hypothetical protein
VTSYTLRPARRSERTIQSNSHIGTAKIRPCYSALMFSDSFRNIESFEINRIDAKGIMGESCHSELNYHCSLMRQTKQVYLVSLVYLVYLVCLVCLVEPDRPDQRDRPDRPNKPASSAQARPRRARRPASGGECCGRSRETMQPRCDRTRFGSPWGSAISARHEAR